MKESSGTVMVKKRLEIDPLPSIENILKEFDFLKYSTQKRNLAYQIQLYRFFSELHSHYDINKGLGKIFYFQIGCIAAAIIEMMLYCSLKQHGVDLDKMGMHKKATGLINMAKKNNLIGKELAEELQEIVDVKNDLHPNKQKDLHVRIVNNLDFVESTLEKAKMKLRESFSPLTTTYNDDPSDAEYEENEYWADEQDCMYCSMIVKNGQMCPACGNIKVGR